MPIKSANPIFPYLDPQFDPNHPSHKIFSPPEDPLFPLRKRDRERLQKIMLDEALRDYVPTHVLRVWENDTVRGEWHDRIFNMTLRERPSDLIYRPDNLHDSSSSRYSAPLSRDDETFDPTDFRHFAEAFLHLGYWRFHPSTDPTPLIPFTPAMYNPEEYDDPTATPSGDVCWIMEYKHSECNTIRRKLAFTLGLFPAACDPNNSAYNDVIETAYNGRLKCRCTRLSPRCIRPSHIEIYTTSGNTLP